MVLFFEKNHSPALLSFGGNCALSSSKLILSTIIQYSILKNLWQRYTFILIFARKSKKKVIDEGFFLPHLSSAARIFSKITPVPSLPLKRGSTSPPVPSPQERAPTGKPDVLYSQTSSRPKGLLVEFLRNRVASVYAPRARLPHWAIV